MENNIFNSENVFYINLNNEVFECKFKGMYMPIIALTEEDFADPATVELAFSIKYIQLLVCGEKGLLKWNGQYNNFNPLKIYRSVDDCINDVNPLFNVSKKGQLFLSTLIMADLDTELTPKDAFWKYEKSVDGNNQRYRLHTYIWNGMSAEEHEFRGALLNIVNGNGYPLYDIVSQQWVVDKEYDGKCYKTYDECVNSNHVKVHRF